MGQLIPVETGAEIVGAAAQASVSAGTALIELTKEVVLQNPKVAAAVAITVAVGVSVGLANGIPQFAKNSWFRWGPAEPPKPDPAG